MATNSISKAGAKLNDNNYIIVILLISLVVLGITAIVGKSLVTTVIRDTKVMAKKDAADKQLEKNLVTSADLISNYKALGEKKLIDTSLPTTRDFSGLIAMLEKMSGSAGITLKDVTPASVGAADLSVKAPQAAGEATPKTLLFSATVIGSYASLTAFLDAAEHASRPIRVTAIQITGSGSQLNANISMTTYYQGKASIPFKLEEVK